MRRLIDCTVAMRVGLGLMGARLRGAARTVRGSGGCGRDPETVAPRRHAARRFIDWGHCGHVQAIAEPDIVVLATPVRTIVKLLGEIGPWVRDGAC